MKYEFVILSNEFKNNTYNMYENAEHNKCIDLTEVLEKNTKLRTPIGIFINGILLESSFYQFKNNVLTVTNNEYPIYTTDRIYMIFTSTSSTDSGFIIQYKLIDYAIFDDNSLIFKENALQFAANKEPIGIFINGVLYGTDLFNIETSVNIDGILKDKITFNFYRPDTIDEVSILLLEK